MTSRAHLDRRPRRVLAGVVEEVADDPLQPARIRLDDDRLGRQLQAGLRQPAGDHGLEQPAEIDRLGGDLLGLGVEAGDLHQVVDERSQPGDVGDEQLAGAAGSGGQ